MSHPIRLRILCQLQDGEKTVGEIQSEIKTANACGCWKDLVLAAEGSA